MLALQGMLILLALTGLGVWVTHRPLRNFLAREWEHLRALWRDSEPPRLDASERKEAHRELERFSYPSTTESYEDPSER